MSSTGALQELYGGPTGALQGLYSSSTGALQMPCGGFTGALQELNQAVCSSNVYFGMLV